MNISILGDSISTFPGYNPPSHAVYFNAYMCKINGLTSLADTWWAQVLEGLDAELVVNDSYSGSLVCGKDFPAANCLRRTHNLSNDAGKPDLILFFIGINDYGFCAPVGTPGEDAQTETFAGAYRLMLQRVRENEPQATLACSTLMRTTIHGYSSWEYPELNEMRTPLEDYNEAIRAAVAAEGATLIDLSADDVRYETLDGVHPTVNGHATIAHAWLKHLK